MKRLVIIIALLLFGYLMAQDLHRAARAADGFYTITLPDGTHKFYTSFLATKGSLTNVDIQGFLVCSPSGTCITVADNGYLSSYVLGTVGVTSLPTVTIGSGTTAPVTVIPWAHSQIHAGKLFSLSGVVTVNSGSHSTIITDSTTTEYHLGYNFTVSSLSSTITCTIRTMEGVTGSNAGGSTFTAYNKNRNSAMTTNLTGSVGASGPPTGTVLHTASLDIYRPAIRSLTDDEFVLKTATRNALSTWCSRTGFLNFTLTWYGD